MRKIATALFPLTVALAGALAAFLWFRVAWWIPLLAIALGVVIGMACFTVGEARLPDHPVAARRWMEGWVLVPILIASAASGAAIWIAVVSNPAPNADIQTKKLLAALASAVTVFLASAFVNDIAQVEGVTVGGRMKTSFRRRYQNYFKQDTAGEHAVYEDEWNNMNGWGWGARAARATAVQQAVLDHNQRR